jgi:hypothetical protein
MAQLAKTGTPCIIFQINFGYLQTEKNKIKKIFQVPSVGFKRNQPKISLLDLLKTQIESKSFVETFRSLKSRKVTLLFSYYKK